MSSTSSPEGALEDIRVLDLAGPMGVYCGKLLADMGADVIKVEEPGGDPMRSRGPFYHDEVNPEKSLYFFHFNTSKRGVTLNLESVDGRAIFKRLVGGADVVLETSTPGYLEGLGLGYEVLKAINPALIMTSITPFGQTGPYRRYKSSDLVGNALAGVSHMLGNPGERPTWTLSETAYHHVSINASTATLIALYHRDITGGGQYIDVSMHEAVSMVQSPYTTLYWDVARELVTRTGVETQAGFSSFFPCKDGYVGVVIRAGPPLTFLCQWLDEDGIEHTLWDERWHDRQFRTQPENGAYLREMVGRLCLNHTKRELVEKAQDNHLSIMPYYDPGELREDPHLNARGFFVEVEHPELGHALTYTGAPYGLSETPWRIQLRAPLIGEHNEEVYVGELGYTREQLALLKVSGAI